MNDERKIESIDMKTGTITFGPVAEDRTDLDWRMLQRLQAQDAKRFNFQEGFIYGFLVAAFVAYVFWSILQDRTAI